MSTVSSLPRPSLDRPDAGRGSGTGSRLTAGQLAHLRGALAEQELFRLELLAFLDRAVPTPAPDAARAEVADAVGRGARQALAEVRAAQARLDSDRYGYCTACGNDLGIDVLEVLPAMECCVPCRLDVQKARGR